MTIQPLAAPRFNAESAPRFNGESVPRFNGESVPRFNGESAPRFNAESAPVTMTFILDGPDATVVADRLASVLNESANTWPATEVTVHHPDVIVDRAAREVYVESERVHLTRREFDLLLHLTQHPGIAFTRLQLLRMVWQHEYSGERTVDVHVRRLRVKLGVHGAQITTLHGFGYRLEPGGRFTTRLG